MLSKLSTWIQLFLYVKNKVYTKIPRMPPIIKIAIIDDHPLVISGLKSILHYYRNIEIIGSFTSPEDLLESFTSELPDVLLLDICMPEKTGNELARIISRKYPEVNILVLTSLDATYHIKDLMDHGCLGYLLKKTDPGTLVAAIEQVSAGRQYIDDSLKDQIMLMTSQTRKASGIPSLTRREKEILHYVVKGCTTPEIAKSLFLSQRTIKNHRFNLMQKLDVKNSAELVRIALQAGLEN
jgi:DNA-binding NarL/FixJ family response regulator